MLLWFKMVVYKFTEKMRGCSALGLQGLDFLSPCLGFVLHVLLNSPLFQPVTSWHLINACELQGYH